MRVAVLADIHGNLPALEAVLGEVDAAGADAIVLPGDMTVGPLQAETLDLLTSLGERAIWVRGNCERNLVEVHDGTYQPTEAAHEPGVIWSGQQLTTHQPDHLASLPLTVSIDVDGLGPVLFSHATARDDEEIVLVDSPLEWFAEGFAGVQEQMIVCGHTHMPFDGLANGCRISRRMSWAARRATPRRWRSLPGGPGSAVSADYVGCSVRLRNGPMRRSERHRRLPCASAPQLRGLRHLDWNHVQPT